MPTFKTMRYVLTSPWNLRDLLWHFLAVEHQKSPLESQAQSLWRVTTPGFDSEN